MKYETWLTRWLEDDVRTSAHPRTHQRYAQIARLHLSDALKETELDVVTPAQLKETVAALLRSGNRKTGGGLSTGSVNGVITVLRDSFTAAEQKVIEAAVQSSKKPKMQGILLCLYTGLRIGELLALRWQDIDFEKSLLIVSHTSRDTENGIVLEDPKTETSRRVIPLPRQLLPRLRSLKKSSHSDFVVANGDQPLLIRSYQRSFELLLKKLHIQHRGFHALRHTFATRALECGMDVRTLSEILGHRNPTVTLNRYAHSLLEHKREMMNRLGRNL